MIVVLLTVTSCRAMIVVHREVSITGREISCRISGWDPLGCRVPQPRIIKLLQLIKARSYLTLACSSGAISSEFLFDRYVLEYH